MRILITGGSGFIGSNLILSLLKEKKYKIVNIDALKYANNNFFLKKKINSKNYKFIKGNIQNKNLIKKIFNQFKPHKIINLAAESHVDKSIDNPEDFIHSNIYGTYNLLNCFYDYWKRVKINKKDFLFYQISTDEVYGDVYRKVASKENDVYNPSSPYSATKASADHLVRAWHKTFNLPVVISCCSNNYGPYQNVEKFIPQVILSALSQNNIKIYGKGDQIRDWIFVEDHIDAITKILNYGKKGETYNIGGNNQISNLRIAKIICKNLDKIFPIKNKKYSDLIKFVSDRPGHDKKYKINLTKIKNKLGFFPQKKITDGLIETIHWYLLNKDLLLKKTIKKNLLKRQGVI